MKKELDYLIINYSNDDMDYIDEICNYFNIECKKIVSFFNLKSFNKKINVYLYSSLEEFRKMYVEKGYNLDNGEVPKWVCGFTDNDTIYTLCYREYIKTKSHENKDISDLKQLIMHEFVHICHDELSDKHYLWLSEGIAINLSHQYDNIETSFNATLEECIYGGCKYINYYSMFKYVYDKYGKDYVLDLINDFDKLRFETKKLYEEVEKFYLEDETKGMKI